MTQPAEVPARCPSCAGEIRPPGAGRILGGVPTAEEIERTRLASADRAALRERGPAGAMRCGSCGDALYQLGGAVLKHRAAAPVVTMAMAADRLRNHLRRRAILRPGRIEGDCYLLPFVRFEGSTPEGDETFALLAASIGEERLEAPFLPPADLKPFETPAEGAAGASGCGQAVLRVQPPSIAEEALRERAASRGWRADRSVELIHFPFWLMRVEDTGRLEGAWMDGIEGKMIHHRLLLPSPVSSGKRLALWAAIPAAGAAVAASALPGAALPAALVVWAGAAAIFRAATGSFRG
ncbi:MAG TPA: hypothetical protein VE404_03865 [Verrucomicrobiae bacterium]|nr:hypothetical protein [Verrucomicrobiae bacterium]